MMPTSDVFEARIRLRQAQTNLAATRRTPQRLDLRYMWLRAAEKDVKRAMDELWGAQTRAAVVSGVIHDMDGNPAWGITK